MLPPTPPFPPNLYSNLESIVVLFFGISIMITLYHDENVDRNFDSNIKRGENDRSYPNPEILTWRNVNTARGSFDKT